MDKFERSRLMLYISERGKPVFRKELLLKQCDGNGDGMVKCHYPAAVEADGVLHIIATADYNGETLRGRGAVLFSVKLCEI